MKQVFKYEIPVDDDWHELVVPGPIVHVGHLTPGVVNVWAETSEDTWWTGFYRVYGTGQPIESHTAAHVGTVIDSPFVWHLYEALGVDR